MSERPFIITREDWETWLSNPITERLFAAFEIWEAQAKESWLSQSWDMGQPDPVRLAALKGRAEVLRQLIELSPENIEDPSGEQQEDH